MFCYWLQKLIKLHKDASNRMVVLMYPGCLSESEFTGRVVGSKRGNQGC